MERPLLHGYYVTRLAKPQELRQNVSWRDIRQREREFFDSKKIWSSNPKCRCGTGILTDALSERLSKMIADRFDYSRSLILTEKASQPSNKLSRLECVILRRRPAISAANGP